MTDAEWRDAQARQWTGSREEYAVWRTAKDARDAEDRAPPTGRRRAMTDTEAPSVTPAEIPADVARSSRSPTLGELLAEAEAQHAAQRQASP